VIEEGQISGSVRAGLDPQAHARMIVATLEGSLLLERFLAGPEGFGRTLAALSEGLRPVNKS
jgi:TetR/AcrR family transcriptional repressor of nem operon